MSNDYRQTTGLILKEILPASGTDPIVVYEGGATLPQSVRDNPTFVGAACFVKTLRAKSEVPSLDKAELPQFELGDSDSVKQLKTLDIEWKNDRIELALLLSHQSGQWVQIGRISLIKTDYPYRNHNLADLATDNLAVEVAMGDRVAVQILDVGYGSLTGKDNVVIYGNWVEELYFQPTTPATGGTGETMSVDLTNIENRLNSIELLLNQNPETDIFQKFDEHLSQRSVGWERSISSVWGFPLPFYRSVLRQGEDEEIKFGPFTLNQKFCFWYGGGLTTRPETKKWKLLNEQGTAIVEGQGQELVAKNDANLYPVLLDTSAHIGTNAYLEIKNTDQTFSWGFSSTGV